MAKKITTTLEITDTHIKCVQTTHSSKKKFKTKCDAKLIDNYTDDEVLQELRNITVSKKIDANNLLCVIPRRSIILKSFHLPSHNDEEIQKMVSLQLAGQIPYALEDVIFGVHIVEKDSAGSSQALAIIVHKDVSDRYVKEFHKVGISLSHLSFSSFGILGWLNYQIDQKVLEGREAIALINIDAAQCEICFCQNRKLYFSRSVAYGAKDLSSESLDKLHEQIELSFATFQSENKNFALHRIIIISSNPQAELLKSRLMQKHSINISITSDYSNIPRVKKIKTSVQDGQLSLVQSVGLGFQREDIRGLINLAPEEVHTNRQLKESKKRLRTFFILVFAVFILGISVFAIELAQKTIHLHSVENNIADIAPRVQQVKEKMKFIEFFENELSTKVFFPELFYELHSFAPQDISFRSIDLNEQGRLIITGYAPSGATVNVFQEKLLKSSRFDEVNLQHATKRRIFNQELTDFKIVCQLNIQNI